MLSKESKKKRLEFAEKIIKLSDEEWENVIFSDETRLNIFGRDRKRGYWSTTKVIKTVKYGGSSVMLWDVLDQKVLEILLNLLIKDPIPKIILIYLISVWKTKKKERLFSNKTMLPYTKPMLY